MAAAAADGAAHPSVQLGPTPLLEVSDLQVRDIMVPRAQMVFVRRDQPSARILPVVVESGHSRFPVMDEDRDDIVGILLAKDLLRLNTATARERFDIREYKNRWRVVRARVSLVDSASPLQSRSRAFT